MEMDVRRHVKLRICILVQGQKVHFQPVLSLVETALWPQETENSVTMVVLSSHLKMVAALYVWSTLIGNAPLLAQLAERFAATAPLIFLNNVTTETKRQMTDVPKPAQRWVDGSAPHQDLLAIYCVAIRSKK
jgi:hypothetical protein